MTTLDLYQELIIDHGTYPRNFYFLDNHTMQAESYNPLCGDQITLFLIVQDSKIIKTSFQGHGCAISTASASIMTELLLGKTIEQSLQLFYDFTKYIVNEDTNTLLYLPEQLLALSGVKNYPARIKCATLGWHTLKSALNKLNNNLVTNDNNLDHY